MNNYLNSKKLLLNDKSEIYIFYYE